MYGTPTKTRPAAESDAAPFSLPLRDWPRVAARTALLFLWSLPLLVVRMTARPLHRLAPEVERGFRQRVMRVWSAGTLRILGVHRRVEGTPPRGHYYIVANHLSYLDIPLFGCDLGCVFVAMSEMANWPVVGFAVRNMNTIFIDRKDWREVQRVNEVVGAALAEEHSVMVFPESTTSYGRDVLPFRPALLEAAVAAGMPVHYASLRYHRTDLCPHPDHDVCWVDDIPFTQHALRLLRVPRIDATIVYAAEPIFADDRKSLARELEDAVRAQIGKFGADSRSIPPIH